jgi:hypothetical protein
MIDAGASHRLRLTTSTRLDLVNDERVITHLNSTSGVIGIRANGAERVLAGGMTAAIPFPFLLGKLAMWVALDRRPA